jgi:hypothetical protein
MQIRWTRPTATRSLILALGAAAGLLAPVSIDLAAQTPDRRVDAVTLAIAVRAGQAKQYEGYTVTGEGRSFDTNCTPADPTTKTDASVVLVVGALGPGNAPVAVQTLEDWVNFQMVNRPMLVVKLRGKDLQIKKDLDPQHPAAWVFTARFTGQTESMTPQASITDNNPKAFQIAVLVDATSK